MQENKVIQKVKGTKKGLWASVVMGAAMLCMSSAGQAALLNLDLQDSPDIVSFVTVSYSEATDLFLASGSASELELGGTNTILSGTFSLSATISDAGVLDSGTLTIDGSVLTFGPSLLTGSLTTLGFDGTGLVSNLEFLFDMIGGDLASMYGSVGGIILGDTGFTGDWGIDFGSISATADTGVLVSAPATLLLFGTALVGLAGFARRKQK